MSKKLFVFVSLVVMSIFALTACSFTVTLDGPANIAGTQVVPGTYKVSVDKVEGASISPTAACTSAPVSTCNANVDEFINQLNTWHDKNRNDVTPVISWLNTKKYIEVTAGSTIPRPQDGFLVFYTQTDLDPARIINTDKGTVVAYFGGGKGTVFGAYDTAITVPVSGRYIVDWCIGNEAGRLNPAADLNYWGK